MATLILIDTLGRLVRTLWLRVGLVRSNRRGFHKQFPVSLHDPVGMAFSDTALHTAVNQPKVAVNGATKRNALWLGIGSRRGEIFIRAIGRGERGRINSRLPPRI